MEESIKKYFEDRKPANIGKVLEVKMLTDGESSNHLNYKVVMSTGEYIARITKPGDIFSYSNLADEYTILKLVEDFDVAPCAVSIDLEYFDNPLLIEEYVEGSPFSQLQVADENMFQKAINLLVKISNIKINKDQFPFKFTYTTYRTNFKAWDVRLNEINEILGDNGALTQHLKSALEEVKKVLIEKDHILQGAPKEFIYNDVHPGNMFWVTEMKDAVFIDWQKVSIGDPTFMVALFARRFGSLWGTEDVSFTKKVLEAYAQQKHFSGIEELYQARILERAASDMVWTVWQKAKKGQANEIEGISKNKYYVEVKRLLEASL